MGCTGIKGSVSCREKMRRCASEVKEPETDEYKEGEANTRRSASAPHCIL